MKASKRAILIAAGLAVVSFGILVGVQTRAGKAARTAVVLLMQKAPEHPPVPVDGVRAASLTDSWGPPRAENRRHKGIDVFAPRGTPIQSTTNGVIARVGANRLGGRIVVVLGPGGYWHYYAHLDRYGDVRRWQVIKAGHVIGYVGDSGNARGTPPHLHYGIYRLHGQATNPYPLLAKRA